MQLRPEAVGRWMLVVLALACATNADAQAPQYQYFRLGAAADVAAKTQAGFALMGGGTDLDEAFRWLCSRAGGGDFLVLRATGDDDYNPYIQPLCPLNSVATLILPNREAANDPFAARTIARAEAIFIAGGDQANYIRFWRNTPVQREINAAIARGIPIGGTSAGLAVLGEWAYSAEGDKRDDPNLDGKTALMNPLGPRVTLVHGFLDIPVLKGIITDTHFARRDRMGRLLAFLAKIRAMSPSLLIRGLGIEEKTAMLLDPDGHGTVVGRGSVYLASIIESPMILSEEKPLSGSTFNIQKIESGKKVNLSDWDSNASPYTLAVEDGKLSRHPASGSIY